MVNKNNGDNVILFPGLIERLIKQAIELRKNENFLDALHIFENVIDIEPENKSALYGLALTYYDIGNYLKSKEVAEQIMQQEAGKDPEVIRLYIVSLIQLEEYGLADEILETILIEKKLPHHLREEFSELQKTCSLLAENKIEEETEDELARQNVLRQVDENPQYVNELYEQLINGNFEQQLSAIERMKYVDNHEVVEMLKEYLVLPGPQPILKTFAIKALKEMGEKGIISVFKFNNLMETKVEDIPLDDEVPKNERNVLDLIIRKTQDKDPSFLTFANQVWMEYLFTLYPFRPDIRLPEQWAAALHYATFKMMNREITRKEAAKIYGISAGDVASKFEELNKVLKILTSP